MSESDMFRWTSIILYLQSTREQRHNYEQILIEMERQNVQLKDEQNRVLTLQNQLKMSEAGQKRVIELQEQVIDLQREVDTLKEANEKLVGRLVCIIIFSYDEK